MRDTAAMTKTMMVAGLWILALGMPLTATAAQDAETMTANLLVNNCQAVDKPYSQRTIDDWAGASACLSYFYGWMDGTRAVAVIIGAQIWCPAADVTVGQMRKVFLKYMADHPEQLHVKDGVMATLALRQAFPCNR